ncbi:MAG TPA: branched-chain amino acid ABC transporter permease, partial [Actinomycetota bacterium]|nr:branched-chain amino acid ABC transporter permease [Actinomycetota bacterium]
MRRSPVGSRLLAAGVLAALGLFAGYRLTDAYLILFSTGCILAVSTLGLGVVVGWAGEISLAQAGLTGTACYLTGYAIRADGWGWSFLPGVVTGIVVATVLAVVVALPTSKVCGIYLMLLTLGLQITIERAVFPRTDLGGGELFVRISRPRPFGISLESERAFFFFTLVILAGVLGLLALFRDSRHGRALLAVRANRTAAASLGISPWAYKVLAFAIGGALAGLAGALQGPMFRTVPNLAQFVAFQSLFYLAVPVLAGFESLWAAVTVAMIFSVVPQIYEAVKLSPSLLAGGAHMVGLMLGRRGVGGVAI